jgi:two-component system C4-dicarboxylate transport response regulator DctD
MDTNANLKQLKILLIDDDEIIRNSMQLAFQQKGFQLQTAGTAEDGLRLLARIRYDIIISDLRLPGMSGLEFLKQVDTVDAIKIMISAHGDHEAVADAYAQGVADFLSKPFAMNTLWATLSMHVEKRISGRQIIDLQPHQKARKKLGQSMSVNSDSEVG